MDNVLNLNLMVDSVPYIVRATPCIYNSEIQYRVSINGNDEVLFVFDTDLGRYAAVGDEGPTVPDNAELAIAEKLNSDSLKAKRTF